MNFVDVVDGGVGRSMSYDVDYFDNYCNDNDN